MSKEDDFFKQVDDFTVREAYMVISFDDGSVEIFDRNYNLISSDASVVPVIVTEKTQVESWRDYLSPLKKKHRFSKKRGDAKWYLPVPSESLSKDQKHYDRLDLERNDILVEMFNEDKTLSME